MSKIYYKGFIEDVVNDKCTDQELEALIDAFEYTMKDLARTLARKAWFELKDYATAKKRKIENFTLTIERLEINGQEQWHGEFKNGNKNLKIIGTLEK